MAAAGGLDPYQLRRKLLEGKPDWLKVLDTAAEKGDWGKPLPKGTRPRHRHLRQIPTASARRSPKSPSSPNGEVKVDRVTVALDTRYMVNPLTIAEQAEGSVIFGLSAALYGKITIKNGAAGAGQFRHLPHGAAGRRRRRSTSIWCRAAARSGAARASPQHRRSRPRWRTRSLPRPASAFARCRSCDHDLSRIGTEPARRTSARRSNRSARPPSAIRGRYGGDACCRSQGRDDDCR